MKEKKKKIIESLKINTQDVGSSQVQIGLLSEKINGLANHFKKNKSDKHSTMGLLKAVNQRKRLLEYLKKNNPEAYTNVLTIIVPRHIERAKTIKSELSNLNLKIVLYSNFEQINNDTDILLIDGYGELKKFYNISKCVFLGKSLIKSIAKDSGQNPIEPSRLGCKIFHGPYISNFNEVYEYLKSLNITKEINNFEELSQSLVEELKNDKKKNDQIIQKIENHGLNIFNNVLKEIKIYINT